jgi:hypothetical protein
MDTTAALLCLLSPVQGVLLPALGTFVVGQALEDRYATYKRYRPTFSLLEGRFGGVSQEKSKFRLLSRAAVAQLNYQLISQDAQIHRSIAQRLLAEILQRLATHIVSGHAIKVPASACWLCQCSCGWDSCGCRYPHCALVSTKHNLQQCSRTQMQCRVSSSSSSRGQLGHQLLHALAWPESSHASSPPADGAGHLVLDFQHLPLIAVWSSLR